MNKALSKEQLAALEVAAPTMTRNDKLERWASVVEKYQHYLIQFDRLEHRTPVERERCSQPGSALDLASQDPVLKDAGLTGGTVGEVKKFFELSDQQIHEFSCNCDGSHSSQVVSSRIRGFKSPITGDVAGSNIRGAVAKVVVVFTLLGFGMIGLLHTL